MIENPERKRERERAEKSRDRSKSTHHNHDRERDRDKDRGISLYLYPHFLPMKSEHHHHHSHREKSPSSDRTPRMSRLQMLEMKRSKLGNWDKLPEKFASLEEAGPQVSPEPLFNPISFSERAV